MKSSIASPILSAGELLWDLLPSGPRLGGTTANFAVLCARLGDYVALVSRVGRDELGRRAMDQLKTAADAALTRDHFDLTAIQCSDLLPTGTVTVTLDEKRKPRYTIESPVAWDEITLSSDLLNLAKTASAVCYGTLAQRQNPSRESIRALVCATSGNCARVCDVNLRMPFCSADTLHWCLEQATVLKVSDDELPEVGRLLKVRSIVPAPSDGTDDELLNDWAQNAAHSLLESASRCRVVAITLGPHGSLLVDRQRTHRHRGFTVKVVDTIGAGDAFTAGMVHAYLRGASLEQINTVSNLCGSYVASQSGATPEVPEKLLDEIRATLSSAPV